MRRRIIAGSVALSTLGLPLVALAQGITGTNPQQGLFGLLGFANSLLNGVIVLFITLAVVAIFWYAVKSILSAGNAKARTDSIKGLIYSVVALTIMVSIWGLVRFLQATFGINNTSSAQAPSVLQIR